MNTNNNLHNEEQRKCINCRFCNLNNLVCHYKAYKIAEEKHKAIEGCLPFEELFGDELAKYAGVKLNTLTKYDDFMLCDMARSDEELCGQEARWYVDVDTGEPLSDEDKELKELNPEYYYKYCAPEQLTELQIKAKRAFRYIKVQHRLTY